MIPNVNIKLGNGALGRVASTADGVAGLVLTGTAVADKLVLNTHYLLGGTLDLVNLGVTADNNFLVNKEVRAFYAQAGEGAELHIFVVADTITLTQMCATDANSPLNQLINASGGRVRLVGVNKLPKVAPTAGDNQIDDDAITAGASAHQVAEAQTKEVRPFRLFMPACAFTGVTEGLFKPCESSYNRVGYVLACDDNVNETRAIGQILGRASKIAVHRSIGRVKDGAIATNGFLAKDKDYQEGSTMANTLNDAGYIIYIKYATKNGCYLNGDPMAVAVSDDYAELHLGRVIDKAYTIVYNTYISEIMDNVSVDESGNLDPAICKNYEGMIENAIGVLMGEEISSFSAFVDPKQNVLSSSKIEISGKIIPQGVIKEIQFNLGFENPAK
ncbi:MAG: hypothetical protein IMY73_02285 [Bacteroidetes bacterium]|nr:hypothetical protein [Bacteroidota bacterium]